MSKAGKKLLKSIREMLKAKQCQHDWIDGSVSYRGIYRMTSTTCGKCGIKYTSWTKVMTEGNSQK